jgi:hypothetical protein
VNVDVVNEAAEIQEIVYSERSPHLTKMKNDPGSQIALQAETFGGAKQFIWGIH